MKWSLLLSLLFFVPTNAVAYVVGIIPPEGGRVADTSVRHVYFGELKDESGVVRLSLPEGGNLNLFLLTPTATAPNSRYDAVIVSESRGEVTAILESGGLTWELYHDAYIAEDFLKGPELSKVVPPGDYRIVINNPGNQGKFGIVIGSAERFSISDYYALYKLGPTLKRDFFGIKFQYNY